MNQFKTSCFSFMILCLLSLPSLAHAASFTDVIAHIKTLIPANEDLLILELDNVVDYTAPELRWPKAHFVLRAYTRNKGVWYAEAMQYFYANALENGYRLEISNSSTNCLCAMF